MVVPQIPQDPPCEVAVSGLPGGKQPGVLGTVRAGVGRRELAILPLYSNAEVMEKPDRGLLKRKRETAWNPRGDGDDVVHSRHDGGAV